MLQVIFFMFMEFSLILEVISAGCSIVYSLLLMKEKLLAWPFGIIASLAGALLFYETQLYGQSLISLYFAGIGIYGWIYWKQAQLRNEHINQWSLRSHLIWIIGFGILGMAMHYLLSRFTDASSPILDSFVTAFGLLASIKEARKILTSWVYWFVINLASATLYYSRGLMLYAILMLVYAIICIPGYVSWYRILHSEKTA